MFQAEGLREAGRIDDLQGADHAAQRHGVGDAARERRARPQAGDGKAQEAEAEEPDRSRAEAVDERAAAERGDRLRRRHRTQQTDGTVARQAGLCHGADMVEHERRADAVGEDRDGTEIPERIGVHALRQREADRRHGAAAGRCTAEIADGAVFLRSVAIEGQPDRQHDGQDSGRQHEIGRPPTLTLDDGLDQRRDDETAQGEAHHGERGDAAAKTVEPEIDHLHGDEAQAGDGGGAQDEEAQAQRPGIVGEAHNAAGGGDRGDRRHDQAARPEAIDQAADEGRRQDAEEGTQAVEHQHVGSVEAEIGGDRIDEGRHADGLAGRGGEDADQGSDGDSAAAGGRRNALAGRLVHQ